MRGMVKQTLVPILALAAALGAAGCGTTAVRPATQTTAVTTPTVATGPSPTPTTTPTTVTAVTVPTTGTFSTPTSASVPAPTPPPRPTRPSHLRRGAHVVPTSTYTRDVMASLSALRGFSSTLQGINSRSQFGAALPSLRRDLRTFDGTIRRLRSYQLMSPLLDSQREKLAQQGPGLARTMSNFLDAVRDGNATRAKQLAAEIQTRLDRFRKAA